MIDVLVDRGTLELAVEKEHPAVGGRVGDGHLAELGVSRVDAFGQGIGGNRIRIRQLSNVHRMGWSAPSPKSTLTKISARSKRLCSTTPNNAGDTWAHRCLLRPPLHLHMVATPA